MNRANLVVPASKAARSKIARNRNGTANSASANKAVINKEASSKAGDRSSYIRLFDGRRQLRPFVCPCANRLQFNITTTAAFIPRDYFSVKSSTQDKIKGGFREAKGQVKEKAGDATGNPNLRNRGTAEKAGGEVQRKIGYLKKVFEQ
jgi:uncharacterized protein YjbJ (UPF0337 family)